MKTTMLVATGFAVVLGAGVAMAQAPAAPPPPPAGPMGGPPMGGPSGEMRGGWEHHGMRQHMGGRGAGFFFRKGDAVIGIKCAENENMKACVDASSSLLDKVGAMGK